MLSSRCLPIFFPSSLFPIIHFSLFKSSFALHSLTLYCLHRHLGFACSYLLDSDSCSSEEHEAEYDLLQTSLKNIPFSIDNRSCQPAHQFSTENSIMRKYSFDKKWCPKDNMMNMITFFLSKQGWDLNFHCLLGIDLDYQSFSCMLNDLFDESLDSSLVYYLFRMWWRWDDIWEHKLQIFCTMIHIAVSGNMNHLAMNLLREIVKSNNSVECGLDFIICTLWKARRNKNELETVYSMLVFCFVEQGMVDLATRLITWMEKLGFYPSNGVYVAVSFLFKSQFTQKAEYDGDLFVKLQSWGARLSGVTLSLFIRDFCAHGCLRDACKLLYDMPTFGGKADNVSYTIIIDAFCKRGYLKEATSLMFKMIQIGLSLDSTLISTLVHGYCKVGRSEAAMTLLSFSGCLPDAYMYNSFILTYCQNGDVESAHQLLNTMLESDVVPDSINYTTIIKGYCKLYRLNHALKTFAKMHIRGIKPTIVTYAVLVDGHCKIDDIQGAEFVFNAMEKDGLHADLVTYNTLINGYSKKGYMHNAYELMDKMKKAGVSPNTVTYNTIMHGLIKRGFDIKTIFIELVRRGYSPDKFYSFDKITFTNIIHGYSKQGKLEEAYLIWCSMSKKEITPDVITCSALLNGFCKMRRMQDADILFHKMLDAGLEPDLILYNTLVHGFCNVGDVSKALQILIMMRACDIFPNNITHCALVTGFEKQGVENAQGSATMLLQTTFSMD